MRGIGGWRVYTARLCCALGVLWCAPAVGQEPPSEPAPAAPAPAPAPRPTEDAEQAPVSEQPKPTPRSKTPEASQAEEEIVVTGTRIKRTSFSTASPVQVIDRAQIERSGAENFQDLIRYLTVNAGSRTDPDDGTTATFQFNLRGLGPSATLVLLNGHRMVVTGAGGDVNFVNVGAIPLAIIERIEILKGGASAIYGSDAVAGVVNIITRKRFEGLHVEASGQAMDDFTQREGRASAALGAASERGAAGAAISYDRKSDLVAADIPLLDAATDGPLSQPASYVDILDATGNSRSMPPGSVVVPDPLCGSPEAGPRSSLGEVQENGDQFCELNTPDIGIIPKSEQVSLYAHAERDLTDHTRVFAEGLFTRIRADTTHVPSFPVLRLVPVPADHADNELDTPLLFIGLPLGLDYPVRTTEEDSDTLFTAGGVRGDFADVAEGSIAEDWEWSVVGTWSSNRYRIEVPDTLIEPFEEALASCPRFVVDGPAGLQPAAMGDMGARPSTVAERQQLGCFNPFYNGVLNAEDLQAGTPMDQTGHTVNSPEVIEDITGDFINVTDTSLVGAQAQLTGSLVELPGGDLGFALGVHGRHERRRLEANQPSDQQALAFIVGTSDGANSRSVLATFAELRAPVVEGLELELAGRHEHYSTVGGNFSPKVGATFRPAALLEAPPALIERLRLRAVYAGAFRAPDLFQRRDEGFITTLEELFDGTQDAFSAVTARGNPDLEPEKAVAISVGVEWAPIEPLSFELDLWHYDYDDIIVAEDPQQLILDELERRRCFGPMPMPLPEDDCAALMARGISEPTHPQVERTSIGTVSVVEVSSFNAASVTTNGLDASVFVDFGARDAGPGKLTLGTVGTYVNAFEIQRRGDDRKRDVSGSLNSQNFARALPKLRLNFPVLWRYRGHGVAAIVHYISAYDDDGTVLPDGELAEIDAFATLDLQYSYTLEDVIGARTSLQLGASNVLDSDPPTVASEFWGFDRSTHDPRGRLVYVRLSQVL